MNTRGRSDGRTVGLIAVLAILSISPTVRLSGQNDPRLKAALQLVQSGRADSARALVRRLLATLPPQDSVYPEALYTQGMIAPDAASAATSLQRVVVEYGWSPWADDALLRLAQLNYAQGDPAGAAQAAERLRRDYPDSPLKARADFWGARGYFDLRDEPHGCALIQEALTGAGEDVEFRNQVSYYAARCGGTAAATPVAVAPAMGTPVPAASPPPPPPPPAQPGRPCRHAPGRARRLGQARGARRVLRPSAGGEKRSAGRRAAHPAQGDGVRRRSRRPRHERFPQGPGGPLPHAPGSPARTAASEGRPRRPAVRGGGIVTQRVEAETALMQQYRNIKARAPGTILFFRMGDFYEMFEDDAKLAARELGLTLTSRNNGGAAEVPLAGVPVKAAADYLRRLVANGHRVAICEQVEDARLAKGVVRRAVIETVTPGAVLSDDWLAQERNNYLAAVLPMGERGAESVGVAALDLTTGEFVWETVPAGELATVLARYEPAELVMPAGAAVTAPTGVTKTEREAWEFDPELAREELMRAFALASLDGLGVEAGDRPAVGAAGALLRYARELKPGGLPHLTRPRIVRRGDVLPLDEMTRRNLELVEPLRPGATDATLLAVLDRTRTPLGARLLRRWLLAPLVDPTAITARLDAVDVLVQDARGRDRLREALDGVRDLERLAGRAALGRATPRDLGALRDSIGRLPDVRAGLDGLKQRQHSALLETAATTFDLLGDLGEELGRALVDRPPAQLADADAIQPGYDHELDELRDARDGGKRYIAGLQARERQRTGIGSLKVGFNKVFGYYIEVTHTHKGRVPANYERRQTLTGAERYATPELKEYEAKVLGAEERIVTREAELVDALRRRIGEGIARVQHSATTLAQLDVWSALADLADHERYVRPEVTTDFTLHLEGSRHPVVERMMPREAFIPNDVLLDEAGRVILLTGPNMAGKSTLLRQVGLCVVLAQMGAFVPARRAVVGVVDRLFTRVGASDNLVRGQSTFMVEMSETSAILHGATARSLVLLDEIGRGTSTYDGVAIAWAVTECLHNRIGAKTVFATHYHELTQLTEELAHARNFNVAVRESGDEIVFLHRLEPGGADRSYGIHVGRLAGLPAPVVARAWEVLKLLEAGHHVADRQVPKSPDTTQFGLFSPHPLMAELEGLDVDALSPLEALNRLAAWKRRLERGEGS